MPPPRDPGLPVVYEGDASVEAWLKGISDGILSRRPPGVHIS
jgi:hypothetical protein